MCGLEKRIERKTFVGGVGGGGTCLLGPEVGLCLVAHFSLEIVGF